MMVKDLKQHLDLPESHHQAKHARSEDIDQREPCLEPKHKVFLCHSGAQKNFTEQLCKDLESVNHYPFLDRRPESLPAGENFPLHILKAVQQCRVAILVLSEEFFSRSKWPMTELTKFVEAQSSSNSRLKIVPLFFGLTLDQLKAAERQKCWREKWEAWASKDARIVVETWVQALGKVLGPLNGMPYDEGVGEVMYRESVVAAVCNLVPADVEYDVSYVQALPRLCKAISQKFDEIGEGISKCRCRVVGLYGMGGAGKTTISKAMYNEYFGDFGGRVCHVELGNKNYVELRKRVLRELTGANKDYLPDELDKLGHLLKTRMLHQNVFLCLDNVLSECDIEEAKMFLDLEYTKGSKVLLTSRAFDVLKSLKLRKDDCMEMPELEKEDATKLLVYYANLSLYENFNEKQWDIIKKCVEACQFSKRDVASATYGSCGCQYLPLALKAWGKQLGDISEDPLRWVESLENLSKHNFIHFNAQDHPLFSILRQGYDTLDRQQQHIFMDLALFEAQGFVRWGFKYNVVDWLCIIYRCSKDDIQHNLSALRRKGLLEDLVNEDALELRIHDLYLEFARAEAEAGPFEKRRILYDSKGIGIPRELLKRPTHGFWSDLERIRISQSKVKSLKNAKLDRCSNVEVMQLDKCNELVEVDVEGMDGLRSLDVNCNWDGDIKLVGVEKLEDLAWFWWTNIVHPAACLHDLSSLTALQVLHLQYKPKIDFLFNMEVTPNLDGCINLRELHIDFYGSMQRLPDLSNLSKLQSVYFGHIRDVRSLSGLSSLTNLKSLTLFHLEDLTEIPGLNSLINLEFLSLKRCCKLCKLEGLCGLVVLKTLHCVVLGLSEIDDLKKLVQVRDLNVSLCDNLTSLVGLECLTSLRRLEASLCFNLKELPDCSNLKELKLVDLSKSGICILPSNFGHLSKRGILKLDKCTRLFDPLVVWLLKQQRQMFKTSDGWVSRDYPFAEQTEGRLWGSIKEVTAYYLDKSEFPDSYELFTTRTPGFPQEGILSSARSLGELEGGIESLIRVLCDEPDLGILSLLVAQYAASGKYWALLTADSSIQAVCGRIVQFLEQQLEAAKALCDIRNGRQWLRIEFIVQHVTKNKIMAATLGGHNICSFIRRCLNDPKLSEFVWFSDKSDVMKNYGDALERCRAGEPIEG